jgi:hypothetical protein
MDTSEIGYPDKFLLFIYFIFREVTDSENEKKKLTTHIQKLENDTGIRSSSSSNGNELSGLFDMAANMAEKVSGSKIPKDKMPGKNEFSKMLGSLVNDPKTKSLLGGVMEQFKNTENIGDVVKTLVNGLGSENETKKVETPEIENNVETGEIGESVNDEFEDF